MGFIENYKSGLRSLFNKANGIDFNAINGFELAKTIENACVIFEGDWGGQIYLTCPMKYIHCTESVLLALLESIDRIEWGCNKGDGRGVFFEIIPAGQGVAGGMGGGAVIDGLWLHQRLSDAGMAEKIASVIAGESDTIDS